MDQIETVTPPEKYDANTEFLIQRGKDESSYVTKASVIGDYDKARAEYDAIEAVNGVKKRIVRMVDGKPYVIVKYLSRKNAA